MGHTDEGRRGNSHQMAARAHAGVGRLTPQPSTPTRQTHIETRSRAGGQGDRKHTASGGRAAALTPRAAHNQRGAAPLAPLTHSFTLWSIHGS
eukprot:5957345-Prymnesium_polylepis.1